MAVSTPMWSIAPSFEEAIKQQDDDSVLNLSLVKPVLYDADNPFNLPPNMFCNLFKLTKDMVLSIVDIIKPVIDNIPDDSGLALERQVLTTVMVLANGEYQPWCGDTESGPGMACVKNAVKRVTAAIAHSMLHVLDYPRTIEQRNNAKKAFQTSENPFPNTMGAMDCFHVRITKPSSDAEIYFNRPNRFYSLNIQMICGPDLKVFYVNARFPGSTHDNHVWLHSTAYKNLSSAYAAGERDLWLIGDGNYVLQPWLMTPIAPILSDPNSPEERYNSALIKALNVVDVCVRALRGTWRILSLSKPIDMDPLTVANVVIVCCIFHNLRCAQKAPPILEPPRKRYRRQRKRLSDGSMSEASTENPSPKQEDPSGSPRAFEWVPDTGELHPENNDRKALGNHWENARNILVNKANLEDTNGIEFNPEEGGRKTELRLARHIQARLVALHFSQ